MSAWVHRMVAAGSLMLTSCTPFQPQSTHNFAVGTLVAPVAPAPEDLIALRAYLPGSEGSVVALGYFNHAEERDPSWEAARRHYVQKESSQKCQAGSPSIRRDIRWFPATAVSGEACAVIVYTAVCQPTNPEFERRLSLDIKNLLASDPYEPMERSCGEKSRAKVHFTKWTQEVENIRDAVRIREMISASAICNATDYNTSSPITIYPDTLISVRTRINKSLLGQLKDRLRGSPYITETESALTILAYRDYKQDPTIARSSKVKRNGRNVFITETFGRGHDASGYCVQLTAIQGKQRWSRSIWRSTFLPRKSYGMLDQMGLSKDPEHYWEPFADARQLAFVLGEDIGF